MERCYVDPHDSFPHNVLLNAKSVGSMGKRTQPGVQHSNGLQFNMAIRITSEHTYAQNARDKIRAVRIISCCIQRLFDTQANHRKLFGAPRRIRIGIGRAMAFECWVQTNEISIFFYVEISAILMYGNGGVAHTQIFTSDWLGTAFAYMSPSVAAISLQNVKNVRL